MARRVAYGYDQGFELLGSAGMLQAGNVRSTEVTSYTKSAVSSDVPEAFFLERYRAAYAVEIVHFFDAVNNGKPVRTTVADGMKALELAEAAPTSWKEKRIVQTRGERMNTVRALRDHQLRKARASPRGKSRVACAGGTARCGVQSREGGARLGFVALARAIAVCRLQ